MRDKLGGIRRFFVEVYTELKRVTWTSRKDLANATAVVMITTAFLAVIIAIADAVLRRVIVVGNYSILELLKRW